MILKTEQDKTCNDIEVHVRYAELDRRTERMISLIRSFDISIKCREEGTEHFIGASEIYYIESVDKRTFVYTNESFFQTEQRLYQLEQELAKLGFVRVSKSCIVNINALESIKPLFNSRMEATLKNGEKLYITRKYLGNIKQVLKEMRI